MLLEAIKVIPMENRSTQRKLAFSLGVSVWTVQKALKKDIFRPHTNTLKPALQDHHLQARIGFALGMRDENDPTKYREMDEIIHLDEKWFYIDKKTIKIYLGSDEEPPERSAPNANGLIKVMFLCAVARPRPGFDGKIGIWPIGSFRPAQRASRNRPAGTLIWNNQKVTQEVYRRLLTTCVLPAIAAKWPGSDRIILQQDGAKAHIKENDEEFHAAVEAWDLGIPISLMFQPAQSSDTNVLDLGFFCALDAFKQRITRTEQELIVAVQEAFDNYPPYRLNYCFLTLMSVCNMILEHDGTNHWRIPHMGKDALTRENNLPLVLEVTDDADWHE
jgi:hypothetical protein